MSYMHIPNLYKEQEILLFRECFSLEKLHGTSAHLVWRAEEITYFSGGEKYEKFVGLFDSEKLAAAFKAIGHPEVTVYGEAYGGKQQGQSWRYGKQLKFGVFEVRVGETWLSVPNAAEVAAVLGLEFVPWTKISADIVSIDAARDEPSEQAKRNGIEGDVPREGVVLRPLIELRKSDGSRIIAKHKRDEERETRTPREVDPAKLKVLQDAEAIAFEWATEIRLEHVLDKLGPCGVERMPDVIRAMLEDISREAAGEIVDSKEARKAIGSATAKMFKAKLKAALHEGTELSDG